MVASGPPAKVSALPYQSVRWSSLVAPVSVLFPRSDIPQPSDCNESKVGNGTEPKVGTSEDTVQPLKQAATEWKRRCTFVHFLGTVWVSLGSRFGYHSGFATWTTQFAVRSVNVISATQTNFWVSFLKERIAFPMDMLDFYFSTVQATF